MIYILKRLLFAIAAIFIWSCGDTAPNNRDIIDFIPENTSAVFKIDVTTASDAGFSAFTKSVRDNALLAAYRKSSPFKENLGRTAILDLLKPSSRSIFCLNPARDSTAAAFTFITKLTPNLFVPDSIKDKTIETLTIKDKKVQRITLNNETVYTAIQDSIFIASSSQKIMLSILKGKTEKDKDFIKVFNIQNAHDFYVVLRDEELEISEDKTVNFASFMGLDITVLPNGLFATGVALARDSNPQLLAIFKGQIPQQNDIAKIIPTDALGALSFTFSSPDSIQSKLKTLTGRKTAANYNELFGSINEVGEIELSEGSAIVLKSIDPSITNESLAQYISSNGDFRDVELSAFSASEMFIESFYPLIRNCRPQEMFQLDNFFVFSDNEEVSKQIITAYLNDNCLDKANFFKEHQSQLSNASSLLIFKMQGKQPTSISGFLNSTNDSEDDIRVKKHPLVALQFSYDRDFAHVNFISKEASSATQISASVSEVFNLVLPNELIGDPQLFTNHRTKDKDVIVQDITNTLQLISSTGKIVWKKKLDGSILGKISEIDILRNGKKQLAFTTNNTFYVLDRTGEAVAPFPLKFNDQITQPLAVFDYDNKRKYRFVITQKNQVFMYDSKGKTVNGFTFKKAKSNIILPPQHLRIGNKDYIAIAEENGKLNLLSRTGKSRINVSKSFNFSETPIQKEGADFVVITSDNKKESIATSGKVGTISLDVSGNYSFSVVGNTKVTLDDNLLRINNKLVELPFGIYTQPQTYFAGNTTYTAITETQENKVYIYDKLGRLLSGFPVYGTSNATIGDGPSKGTLRITVKGDSKEVLLYSKH